MRRLTCALLFLLAGAACTVLVAWACAYWRLAARPASQVEGRWPAGLGEGWPPPLEVRDDWIGGSERFFKGTRRIKPPFHVTGAHIDIHPWDSIDVKRTAAGLPFPALCGDESLNIRGWQPEGFLTVGDQRLPARPLWPGFVADTTIYAATLALVICGPGSLRRHVRLRAGRCLTCGYDRRGLAPAAACPECGAAPRPA